jgi:hypothetical protein
MILAGTKEKSEELGPALPTRCDGCDEKIVLNLAAFKKRAHVFRVSLLPLGTRHVLYCPRCGHHAEVAPEKLDTAKASAEAGRKWQSEEMSRAEFFDVSTRDTDLLRA